MGQLLIRNLDDNVVAMLKWRAKAASSSLEAEARKALQRGIELTSDEKSELIEDLHAEARALMVPGAEQVEGWVAINEGRDER